MSAEQFSLFSSRVGMIGTFPDFSALESVFVSAMHLRSADAKRPGMHSNAKRWNEAERAWPK